MKAHILLLAVTVAAAAQLRGLDTTALSSLEPPGNDDAVPIDAAAAFDDERPVGGDEELEDELEEIQEEIDELESNNDDTMDSALKIDLEEELEEIKQDIEDAIEEEQMDIHVYDGNTANVTKEGLDTVTLGGKDSLPPNIHIDPSLTMDLTQYNSPPPGDTDTKEASSGISVMESEVDRHGNNGTVPEKIPAPDEMQSNPEGSVVEPWVNEEEHDEQILNKTAVSDDDDDDDSVSPQSHSESNEVQSPINKVPISTLDEVSNSTTKKTNNTDIVPVTTKEETLDGEGMPSKPINVDHNEDTVTVSTPSTDHSTMPEPMDTMKTTISTSNNSISETENSFTANGETYNQTAFTTTTEIQSTPKAVATTPTEFEGLTTEITTAPVPKSSFVTETPMPSPESTYKPTIGEETNAPTANAYVEPTDDEFDPVVHEQTIIDSEAFSNGEISNPAASRGRDIDDFLREEEEEVKKVGGWMGFAAIVLAIWTAYQMSENPDGICASACRLVITVLGCVVKILLMPFRYLFGGGRSSGGHYMATPSYRDPYGSRHMELT